MQFCPGSSFYPQERNRDELEFATNMKLRMQRTKSNFMPVENPSPSNRLDGLKQHESLSRGHVPCFVSLTTASRNLDTNLNGAKLRINYLLRRRFSCLTIELRQKTGDGRQSSANLSPIKFGLMRCSDLRGTHVQTSKRIE